MPGTGQRPVLGDLLLCACGFYFFWGGGVTCAATMTLVVLADTDWVLTQSKAW